MISLSDEQRQVIEAPLVPMSVIACAGSGKTLTAVHRLAWIRQKLANDRGYIALLSFSNTAVDTFREKYQALMQSDQDRTACHRVVIDTLDGFFAKHILHPHGYLVMKSNDPLFLVNGNESLFHYSNYTFKGMRYGRYDSISYADVKIDYANDNPRYYYNDNNKRHYLSEDLGKEFLKKLGAIGAYTHDHSRYWCYRVLFENTSLCNSLSKRYPYILIDEAQDISQAHQKILELMIHCNCQISLIGDWRQAIYEFADADGEFLKSYGNRIDVNEYSIRSNYRSVHDIVHIANKLASDSSVSMYKDDNPICGSYYIPYKDHESVIHEFFSAINKYGLNVNNSAVISRRNIGSSVIKLNKIGYGLTSKFIESAIYRDVYLDYNQAFHIGANCVIQLLNDCPSSLHYRLISNSLASHERDLRRLIWKFCVDSNYGIPSSSLSAKSQWKPLLIKHVTELLEEIMAKYSYHYSTSLNRKLTNRDLPECSLVDVFSSHKANTIRTVHKVKGETLDAVLYLADGDNVRHMLDGVETEEGRIGYVAVTRARRLLWLGVPQNDETSLRSNLLNKGFRRWDL